MLTEIRNALLVLRAEGSFDGIQHPDDRKQHTVSSCLLFPGGKALHLPAQRGKLLLSRVLHLRKLPQLLRNGGELRLEALHSLRWGKQLLQKSFLRLAPIRRSVFRRESIFRDKRRIQGGQLQSSGHCFRDGWADAVFQSQIRQDLQQRLTQSKILLELFFI